MIFNLKLFSWTKNWRRRNEVNVLVIEFGDFTDPRGATAVLEATLPKKEFQHRPDVWRSSGDSRDLDEKDDYILLETGRDVVMPNSILQGRESEVGILFELADEEVLFDVTDGKYVADFRVWSDYHDLQTFTPTFTGESARERYFWISKVAAVGRASAALKKRKSLSFLSKYWGGGFSSFPSSPLRLF